MKKLIYTLFVALIVARFSTLTAQQTYISSIAFENKSVKKQNGNVFIQMDINISNMDVTTTQMVVLTPVLRAADTSKSIDLPSVVINGKNRNKAYNRSLALNGTAPVESTVKEVVKRTNGTAQTISYTTDIPFSDWMDEADIVVKEIVTGCAECGMGQNETALLKIEKTFVPVYILTYIAPEVEPVKTRNDRHSATFNYKVNRYELLHDFGNNAREFNDVDNVISEVKGNNDIRITEFAIAGYASPEGNFQHNRTLAHNRANSFADYLVSKHGVNRSQFKVEGYGEDWKGLREAVQASNMVDKADVLRIIDNATAPDAKDAEFKKLSAGNTYRTLLQTYYPPLRRTEYTIAYVVRAFNVEEAKEIIKKTPKLLSLNEMYLVAQTYPAVSKEFKEVFDIASRLYPNDPIAILNSAAADIEGGNYQAAINRLSKIENDPRAWNNLGVAYARMGDTESAKTYFDKAAAKGDKDAVRNAETLKRTLNK